MKDQITSIYNYTISDVSATAGRIVADANFHVYRTIEFSHNEKIINHPIRSDHYIISLVVKGECGLQLNLRDHALKKNSLFITPPNVIHLINDPYRVDAIAVGFTKDFLKTLDVNEKQMILFDFFSQNRNPHILVTDDEAKKLYNLFILLQEKYLLNNNEPYKEGLIRHGFNFFILEIATIFKKYQPHDIRLTRKENILFSFLDLLGQNFKEERTVQFYADALFITPKHLTRIAKELTNKTCGELRDEMVIIEAKILLKDLNLSVANAASQLRFCNQFFFSKFFKKHTGINPSNYKKTTNYLA